jgi:hypothetical protein
VSTAQRCQVDSQVNLQTKRIAAKGKPPQLFAVSVLTRRFSLHRTPQLPVTLEVEGSREDVPLLTKHVASQLAGVLMPAASIVEGKATPVLGREVMPGTAQTGHQPAAPARTPRKRRVPSPGGNGAQNGAAVSIVWQHDADTWGAPQQSWKAVDKTAWLLYVAKQVGAAQEMSVTQMVTTFDRLFRTAGRLNKGNIARDFTKLNSEPPPKVQVNGTVDPATWYLTDAGVKHAENLVKAARGELVIEG